MNNMKDLTVIIPIQTLNDSTVYQLFLRAVKSVGEETDIVVVGNAEAIGSIGENVKVEKMINSGDTSYASQVNFAAKTVKTKYFAVLEFDDEFTPIWFKNAEEYITNDTDNCVGYLPLTEIVDYTTKKIIGYANEAFWASSFSEKIGELDLNSMEDYLNFNTSGAIFNREAFLSLGGLKASMKIVFWYEFLLRALYKEKKIIVIPKVGYYHNVNRDNSLTSEYAKTISEKEADWWYDTAKKEYFFPQDRNKVYEEE